MSEEEGVADGLMVMEDEHMKDEWEISEIQERSSPVGEQSTVTMTGKEFTNGSIPDRDVGKGGLGLSELSSSLLGSCQSLHSSQGSKKEKMITYVPPSEGVKVLQFEDTLSETDCRNFNLIYE